LRSARSTVCITDSTQPSGTNLRSGGALPVNSINRLRVIDLRRDRRVGDRALTIAAGFDERALHEMPAQLLLRLVLGRVLGCLMFCGVFCDGGGVSNC
jgi:hypothetical protein